MKLICRHKLITGNHWKNCYWSLLTSLPHPRSPVCDSLYPWEHFLVRRSCVFHPMDAMRTDSVVMPEFLRKEKTILKSLSLPIVINARLFGIIVMQ